MNSQHDVDPANIQPGQHAPVPESRDDLMIEALRTANRMGGLLNEIAAWANGQSDAAWGGPHQAAMTELQDLLCRRFSDGSALHLFIAANNLRLDLPPDIDGSSDEYEGDDE